MGGGSAATTSNLPSTSTTPTISTTPPPSSADAARFLEQATFGVKSTDLGAGVRHRQRARAIFVNTLIINGGAAADSTVTGSTGTSLELTSLSAMTDPNALVTQLSQLLMHGSSSALQALRSLLR